MKKLVVCLLTLGSLIGSANAQVKPAPAKPAVKPAATGAATAKPIMKNLMDSFSYAVGVNVANNMKEQGITSVNSALVAKAMDDVFKNGSMAMTAEQCNGPLKEQMAIFSKKKDEVSKKQAGEIKAKGEAFLATNKARKEVTTLPDGLQYEIMTAGDGATKPTAQDTVVVDYIGTTIDGKQFDASTGRGPATFGVTQVIKGWTEILQLMTKGAHWKVYIPSELAYGDRGAGAAIPGGSTLIFEITLLDIKPAVVK